MEKLEFKNPFTAGQVVSRQTPMADYEKNGKRGESDFVLGRSSLMEFAHCPRRWIDGYTKKESDAMLHGSLVDALITGPEHFSVKFAVAPPMYPAAPRKKGDAEVMKPWNWNANYCDEWRQDVESIGKVAVHYEDYEKALEAANALKANELFMDLFAASERQVYVKAQYNDRATGITVGVKALIDLLPTPDSKYSQCVADLKTSCSGSPRIWTRHVKEHNLHVQAAMYLDIYNAASGEERCTFLHPIQENYTPWHVVPTMLSQEFINLGRDEYLSALRLYCQCVKTGVWPSYAAPTWVDGWRLTEPEAWMVKLT